MASTRGKGTADGGTADTAAPRTRRTRTRAPEDEISGTAAPEAAPAPEAPARGRGRRAAPGAGVAPADTPAAEPAAQTPASRGRGRAAPGTGVAETAAPAPTPAAPAKKKGGRKQRETYVETAARRRKEKEIDELQSDLRAFAAARPAGWNHEDWVAFLGHLAQRGHDVSDNEHIGMRLENERLAVALEGIEGLGPKRVHSLVERFKTLWSIRQADAASIAGVHGMTRPLAERVAEQLRERYT